MTLKYFNVKNGLTTGNIILNAGNSNISASTFIGNISATGTANLGSVSNVKITGGTANYVLQTDGTGNLSWVAQSGGGGSPGGANTQVQYNDSGTFNGNSTFTFNETTTTLTANNFIATSTANLGAAGNVIITGGNADYILSTDGSGNLSWVSQNTTAANIVVDNFTGNGVQTEFTLSVTPDGVNSTMINYNGAILQRDSYTLTGANVTFDSAPANGSSIEVTTTAIANVGTFATTGKAIAMAIVFGF